MADYISAKEKHAPTGCYVFEKEFMCSGQQSFRMNIFAVRRYILYLNEEYVCEGPCRSSADIRYYDSVEAKLKDGVNRIKVLVMHLEDERLFTTVFHATAPMLIFSGKADSFTVTTDESWKCSYLPGHQFVYLGNGLWSLPPMEDIHAELAPVPKETACVEGFRFDFEAGLQTHVGVASGYHLVERSIPMIYPGEEVPLRVVKEGVDYVELDAGEYVTAFVAAAVEPYSDVKILYSECYYKENGKEKRDDTSGSLQGGYDHIHTEAEAYAFRSFWYRAFRFIRIEGTECKRVAASLKIRKCHYPFTLQGTFSCSDDAYNQMQAVSVNTMRCCTHELFVDCPHYEQQQYIMDSAVEAAVWMRMTDDTRIVKKCIMEFAASQHADGQLSANYPSTGTQTITGFSLFWILLLKEYVDYTGDIAFARSQLGTLDKVLMYFAEQVAAHGSIVKTRYWDYVDWVPGWVRGVPNVEEYEALTVYNMYYACALRVAESLCRQAGRTGLATEYAERYVQIKQMLFDKCYDEERGLFRDGSETREFSAHTIIWAALSEVVTKAQAKNMFEMLWDADVRRSSFSMNYFLFRALEKCDCYDMAFQVLDEWKKMLDWNCTTWCENPDSPRSECHGWSSAPLYEFSANILGVKLTAEDEIIIAPRTGHLTHAEGVVPTRFGKVSVSWRIKDGKFEIETEVPENVRKRVIMPDR